jgi:hypothetical protein
LSLTQISVRDAAVWVSVNIRATRYVAITDGKGTSMKMNKIAGLLTTGTICCAIVLPAVAQGKMAPVKPAPGKPAPPAPVVKPAPQKDEFRRLVDNFGDDDKKIYKGMTKAEKGLLKKVAHMGKQVTNTIK